MSLTSSAFEPHAADPAGLAALSDEDRLAVGASLRDWFFAHGRTAAGPHTPGERAFRAVVDQLAPQPGLVVDGLTVSFHPSARCKQLRFVDEALVDEAWRDRFARPVPGAPHLLGAFVDPYELSFRTYENIVPLDRLFARALEPDAIALTGREPLGGPDGEAIVAHAFAIRASARAAEALAHLDRLDLYTVPMNGAARGGQRYVFHAAALADALTAAVREALPPALADGFSHVNPVFRCNRFEPGDEDFHDHLDTPYRDASRRHVSKYTLLLYLTGGTAAEDAPALRIADGVRLDRIAPMTAVVFDQRHEHAGAAYSDGRKVFLRTELVFEDPDLEHDPAVAERFARATWLTGESLFAPELARYAAKCYDRAAAGHWRVLTDDLAAADAPPLLHKQYEGVHYLANGYDFWFPEGALPLEECAAITLLDVLNCSVGGAPFRSRCTSEIVRCGDAKPGPDEPGWITAFLRAVGDARPDESPLADLDKDALFPSPELPNPAACCPFHAWPHWRPARDADVVDLYRDAQGFARRRIAPAPVLMLGQQVFLDPSRFRVEPGRISVLSEVALAPVNFAACWNAGGSPENYLGVELELDALQPLVPPILYRVRAGTVHLMFDLFRNGWMVRSRAVTVPVPRVSDLDPGVAEEEAPTPWFDAVGAEDVQDAEAAATRAWTGVPTARDVGGDADDDDDADDEDADDEDDDDEDDDEDYDDADDYDDDDA